MNTKQLRANADNRSLTTEGTIDLSAWTIDDVALFLKTSVKKIYRLIKNGEIPNKKVGGEYRFSPTLIDRWLKGDIYE